MTPTLILEVKSQEGFRPKPYCDTLGFLTIGYGVNLDNGISETVAAKLLEWQLAEAESKLSVLLPFWGLLSNNRQDVLTNMAFNLGVIGLMGFKNMLAAAQDGNIDVVCAEMQNSKWAGQVKTRADYLIDKYRKG